MSKYVSNPIPSDKSQVIRLDPDEIRRKAHNHGRMVETIMGGQSQPTKYNVPEEGQKLRAIKLFSLRWRYLNLDIPAGYREALLCVIDHANTKNGRTDTRQRIMAIETGLSHDYINEALRWWADNTCFLKIENRVGRSNAYHVQWSEIEEAWTNIQVTIRKALGGIGL